MVITTKYALTTHQRQGQLQTQTKQEQVDLEEQKEHQDIYKTISYEPYYGGIQIPWSWEECCDLINKADSLSIVSTTHTRKHTYTYFE